MRSLVGRDAVSLAENFPDYVRCGVWWGRDAVSLAENFPAFRCTVKPSNFRAKQ